MTTKQAWLKSQITANPTLSLEELLSQLNTQQLVANPVPQNQVSVPLSIDAIADLVPPLERFTIQETQTYSRLLEAVAAGNNKWISDQIANLVAAGKMSVETVRVLTPLLVATMPDPNWQAQILLTTAQQAGFGSVLVTELMELF